jgi:hypothetical protein
MMKCRDAFVNKKSQVLVLHKRTVIMADAEKKND